MADYDISQAFKEIENELIDSMMRNFSRHRVEENKEGYLWSQWQAEQLKSLEQYRKMNSKKFNKKFSEINSKIEEMLRTARVDGNAEQEAEILQAIKDGFKIPEKPSKTSTAEFFKINDRKLDALIKATANDLKKAEIAILRMSNDKYRKAIFNAQVYANSGAGTYEKAVDMACRDMLRAGLNCVEYKNGARHTLADYADMAIRTANKRAYLMGEGEKRQEWGISLVVVNSRQGGCPDCAEYIGKIFIDDVYSGGKPTDGNYPLLSEAIKNGLFHPRCKDSTSTYYEGITTLKPVTSEEMAEMDRREKLEQQHSYYQNQTNKNQRIADYSLDDENYRTYQHRANQNQKKADEIEKKLDETVTKTGEFDFAIKPGKNIDAIADLSIVKSESYIKKFDDIEVTQGVKEKLSKLSTKIIERRDGTNIEEIYAIEKDTGRILSFVKGKADFGANMSKHFKKVLKTHKEGSIIILHNHPLNFTFSTSDVKTASKYKSIGGVIAVTHAGEVHCFMGSVLNYEQIKRDFRIAYTKYRLRNGEPDEKARILAWDDTFRKAGIKFSYE